MTYQCQRCGRQWDDLLAIENELRCSRKCGGQLVPASIGADAGPPCVELPPTARLPYPLALTAGRLQSAIDLPADVLKTLFSLKDCFEATIKYLGVVLLTEYVRSTACTPERNESLLEKMIRPSLGVWVSTVVGDLSRFLVGDGGELSRQVAGIFMQPPRGRHSRPPC